MNIIFLSLIFASSIFSSMFGMNNENSEKQISSLFSCFSPQDEQNDKYTTINGPEYNVPEVSQQKLYELSGKIIEDFSKIPLSRLPLKISNDEDKTRAIISQSCEQIFTNEKYINPLNEVITLGNELKKQHHIDGLKMAEYALQQKPLHTGLFPSKTPTFDDKQLRVAYFFKQLQQYNNKLEERLCKTPTFAEFKSYIIGKKTKDLDEKLGGAPDTIFSKNTTATWEFEKLVWYIVSLCKDDSNNTTIRTWGTHLLEVLNQEKTTQQQQNTQ
jgi:hypothetical protein